MRVAGLSGGIATGKSFVVSIWLEHHVLVIECDAVARDVLRNGRWAYQRVVRHFGSAVVLADGEIDRDKLAQIIYADAAQRRLLNKLTHPAVLLEILKRLVWAWLEHRWLVVIDMPLLFETGFNKFTRPNILVTCSEDDEVQRLMQRDKCGQTVAQSKVAAQLPLDSKRKRSHFIIDNSGSEESTRSQAIAILRLVQQGSQWRGFVLSPSMLVVYALVAVSGICWHT